MNTNESRPKIHRGPLSGPGKADLRSFAFAPVTLNGVGGVRITIVHLSLLAVIMATVSFHGLQVLSEHLVDRFAEAWSDHAPMSEAMASAPDVAEDKRDSQSVVIQEDGGTIVGRFTKIPMQNDQVTEFGPGRSVDKDARRELLSIISKY